jgi:S1-C subfamily serine protease
MVSRRTTTAALLLTIHAVSVGVGTAGAGDRLIASGAVVKVFATVQGWDIYQPWDRQYVTKASCSGFFIDQGILTNAHCIADATFVEVQIPETEDRVTAEVQAVNHQVDLALLRLHADAGARPGIAFGELPDHLDPVVTVGYPTGGEQVSFTEGVVSRIDLLPYAHSNIANLLVQTDAAINPGNSGGPVFSRDTGLCLGLATQTQKGDGLGYFIPSPVIRQFLGDLGDGVVDGMTNFGIKYQTLENSVLRESLHLPASQSGIRVTRIAAGGSADGVLQRDDVVLSIDGHAIRNDGTITFRPGSTIPLDFLLTSKQVGDEVAVRVLRSGRAIDLSVALREYRTSIIPNLPQYDRKPRYVTLAGLVFLAVEPRYLELFTREDRGEVPPGIAIYKDVWNGTDDLTELVVISRVLAAPINKGYRESIVNVPVKRVNGIEITSFDALKGALGQKPPGPYIDIELASGANVRIKYEEVGRTESEIRARYGIVH